MHVLVTAQWCNDGTANVMSACLLAQQELALLAFAEEERTDWMAGDGVWSGEAEPWQLHQGSPKFKQMMLLIVKAAQIQKQAMLSAQF
eukprot:1159613-Pelagomonas_calceolata.AAC.11